MELAALVGLFAGAGAVLSRPSPAAAAEPASLVANGGDAYDDQEGSAPIVVPPRNPVLQPPPPASQPSPVVPQGSGRSAAGPPPLFDPASPGERSFSEFVAGSGSAALGHPIPESKDLDRYPPESQPYFRSERTQGTNPRTSQFKTELFSGATRTGVSETGTWQHKRESELRFHPKESAAPVTSSGRSDNPTFEQSVLRERFVASGTQQNILPAEQLRIGPAVGYAANVAAADGFHPFLRVMPNNVGEYRLTQLPGVVVPGAAHIGQGTSRDFVQNKNKNALTFFERSSYPMAPVGDQQAFAGPAQRPREPRRLCNSRDNKHPGDIACFGPAAGGDGDDDGGCGSGGAPVNRTFAVIRDTSGSRPLGWEQFTATREANNRSQNPPATAPGPAGAPRGVLAHGMASPQFAVDEGRFEKLHRESMRPFSALAGVQAASARAIVPSGGQEAQWEPPQTTMRDVTGAVPFNVGIAAPAGDRSSTVAAPQRQGAYLQLDRHAKRGDQVTGHVPNPSMTRSDNKTFGDVGMKGARERGGRIMGTAELQVNKPGFRNEQRGNDTRFGRKSGPENTRLWNTLAANQLKTNKFAKTLAEA